MGRWRSGNCKKESKENARKKSIVTEIKNAFDGLISRHQSTAEESIGELEDRSIEISQILKGKREGDE